MDEVKTNQLEFTKTKRSNLHRLISKTYLKVAMAILLTGIVSFTTSALLGDRLQMIDGEIFFGGWFILFIALITATVKVRSFVAKRENRKANISFYAIAAVFGLFLTLPLSYYSLSSIGASFVISSALFLGLAKFGTNSKSDYISWGKTLLFALIGVIIISFFGIFFSFGSFNIILNIAIMILFSFYIVFDSNQLIKRNQDIETADIEGISTLMAIELYLDFINLFQAILELFGSRD